MSESEDDRMRRLLTAKEPRRLPKRFYKQADYRALSAETVSGFAIELDGRVIKTPMKVDLVVDHHPLAEIIVAEWQGQEQVIDVGAMFYTKLANTALDRVRPNRQRVIDELIDFAGSDLICYRADKPDGLILRQQQAWDPILDIVAQEIGARFTVITGIMPSPQPASALAAFNDYLAGLNDFQIAGFYNLAGLTSSALMTLAVFAKAIDGEAAWRAAHIDEDWTTEYWGEDEEAASLRQTRRVEFNATLDFIAACYT